jgi:hypothetical protein
MSEQLELISLADLIEQIKTDLLTKGVGNNPAFFIDGVEIAAQVVARREKAEGGKAGLGISLAVLGLRADAGVDTKTTLGSQLTQTVTIKLSPLLSKEHYLAQLGDAERERVTQTAAELVARGTRGGSGNPV